MCVGAVGWVGCASVAERKMGHGWNNNNLEKKTMNVTVTVEENALLCFEGKKTRKKMD